MANDSDRPPEAEPRSRQAGRVCVFVYSNTTLQIAITKRGKQSPQNMLIYANDHIGWPIGRIDVDSRCRLIHIVDYLILLCQRYIIMTYIQFVYNYVRAIT